MKPGIVIVCGPTATGKTDCAVQIALRFSGEVVNADSMQVYRGMDIGTAKPTPMQRAAALFHLIDIASPDETFSAGRFRKLADEAVAGILARNRLPVIAGGTGLYLKTLTRGIFEGPGADPALRNRLLDREREIPGSLHAQLRKIDPEKASSLPPTDLGRIVRALEVHELTGIPLTEHQRRHGFAQEKYRSLWIGLDLPRDLLYRRINERVEKMIAQGWVEEVAALRRNGFGAKGAAVNALGYRTLLAHLDGKLTLVDAVGRIQTETRNFAKRQRTWFKGKPEIQRFQYPEQMDMILDMVGATVEDWRKSSDGNG